MSNTPIVEMVTIPKSAHDNLLDRSLRLTALEHSGVDNWEWYGDAMQQYEAWVEEERQAQLDPDGQANET